MFPMAAKALSQPTFSPFTPLLLPGLVSCPQAMASKVKVRWNSGSALHSYTLSGYVCACGGLTLAKPVYQFPPQLGRGKKT